MRVRGAERLGDPRRERDRLVHGERPALEARLDHLTIEPLHDEGQLAGRRHAVGDVANDAGVRQLGEQLALSLEPRGAMASVVGDDLDGHHLARDRIARAKDLAHAAAPDPLLELEPLAELLAGHHGEISPSTTLDALFGL